MTFLLSPGVNVTEIDLTTIIPSVGTTEGAFAGDFIWGPVNDVYNIENEQELVRVYGKPDANTFPSFFTCANFLAYARSLRVVRAANTNNSIMNAVAGNTAICIANRFDYEHNYLDLSASSFVGMFAARYPGEIGNSLKVSLWASANATAFLDWEYTEEFDAATSTSEYVSGVNGANDEMHIIVIDEDGKFTGTANTVLEKYPFVSKAYDAKYDNGSGAYWVDVINQKSKYIYAMNPAMNLTTYANEATNWGAAAANTEFSQDTDYYTMSLAGGITTPVTQADLIRGYDHFANPEEIDISLIMMGDNSNTVSEYVIAFAETRMDCVVFVSPNREAVVDNDGFEAEDIIAERNEFPSSSYAVMDNNWKYQFDKYNNVYRWLPMNGDIAGLCVRTDFERDPWWSPAGYNRGQIKNVTKLAWNANRAERDDLYKVGVNAVVTFPGEGTILFGDKTMLARPSAFDRINVRRLFIVLEKAISKAAKYSLFEFNDEFTRAQFVSLVEPYLRDVQGRRGIYDFRVVCDTTNNTPEVIDRNEFVGDIYIKPARSINFIQLNFIAVRTGVAFEEIVGRF
jgi:hypothetical protein